MGRVGTSSGHKAHKAFSGRSRWCRNTTAMSEVLTGYQLAFGGVVRTHTGLIIHYTINNYGQPLFLDLRPFSSKLQGARLRKTNHQWLLLRLHMLLTSTFGLQRQQNARRHKYHAIATVSLQGVHFACPKICRFSLQIKFTLL